MGPEGWLTAAGTVILGGLLWFIAASKRRKNADAG